MDQNKLLKELRAQRELQQAHLEWLDQKITALEGESSQNPFAYAEASPKSEEPPPEESAPIVAPVEIEPDKLPGEELERVLKQHHSASGDPILQAKIGCLAIFAFGTLLFLFLLFGLPYLLD
ncbi:MAG: hypothetical protein ACPGSB_04095 [Opitutales bacterium]